MGTLTITAAGFATLGATGPANWPSDVTFPANGNPNGSKVYTISDADWLQLLAWVADGQFRGSGGGPGGGGPGGGGGGGQSQPATPTAQQILLAWLAIWVNGTKTAIQQRNTVPAQVPAPIAIS